MSYPSTLRDLQEAISARLKDCVALAGIDIFDRRQGELESEIDLKLASIGATLFVSPVKLRGITPDVPAVSGDDSEFTVRIFEDPTTNGTGRDLATLREIVMRRLHQWDPGIAGVGVVTIDPDPEDDASRKKKNVWDVLFKLSVTLEEGID